MRNWIIGEGPENDIVLSSRIRLARNLEDVPFPWLMGAEQIAASEKEISEKIKSVLAEGIHLSLENLSLIEKQVLVERHLISPDLANRTYGGLVMSKQEDVSIMLNEEDHVRLQIVLPGLRLSEAYQYASELDNRLGSVLDFAFEEKLGYKTCCLTNVGTGMRASLMLHLPGLVRTGNMHKIEDRVGQLGLVIRGIYGEGTKAVGDIFQISNQVTLGKSEEELIENIQLICSQIIIKEREHRNYLLHKNKYEFEDQIYRAYGILKNSRLLDNREFLELLSEVRIGLSMGILKDLSVRILNEIMVEAQPASLQKKSGREMDAFERSVFRAEYVRESL